MNNEQILQAFASSMKDIYYRAKREEWSSAKREMYEDALYLVLLNFGFSHKDFTRYMVREIMLNPSD